MRFWLATRRYPASEEPLYNDSRSTLAASWVTSGDDPGLGPLVARQSAAHGEEQVRRMRRLDDASAFQLDRLVAEIAETPLARAQQHGADVQPQLIDRPGG
jgi:hypothetical protein